MKKAIRSILLLSLSLFIVKTSSAQVLPFAWVHQTTTGADIGEPLVAVDTINDYVYAVCSFEGSGLDFGSTTIDNSNPSSGSHDIFIAKYDLLGTLQWVKSFGGYGEDNASGVAIDGSGNIIVAGYFDSDTMWVGNLTVIGTNSNFMPFLAKFDGSGNTVWAKSGTSGAVADFYSVTCDAAGNIFAAGDFFQDVTFGSQTISDAGGGLLVGKFDSNGNAVWLAQTHGDNTNSSAGTALGYAIALDHSGNVVVAGPYSGDIDFGANPVYTSNTNYFDRFVAKLDANGSYVWAKGDGIWQGPDQVSNLSIDAQNNIYLAGEMDVATVDVNTNDEVQDYFVEKRNSAGSQQWIINGGGDITNGPYGITTDNDGNSYVDFTVSDSIILGSTSLDPVFQFGAGSLAVVMKVDASGNIQWVKADEPHGTVPIALATSIAHDTHGNLYIVGGVEDTAYFDNFHLAGTSATPDFYIAKLGSGAAGIEQLSNTQPVTVSPNPSSTNFTLHFAADSKAQQMDIYNLQGQLLRSGVIPLGATEFVWDGKDAAGHVAANGMYLCRITFDKGLPTQSHATQMLLLNR